MSYESAQNESILLPGKKYPSVNAYSADALFMDVAFHKNSAFLMCFLHLKPESAWF